MFLRFDLFLEVIHFVGEFDNFLVSIDNHAIEIRNSLFEVGKQGFQISNALIEFVSICIWFRHVQSFPRVLLSTITTSELYSMEQIGDKVVLKPQEVSQVIHHDLRILNDL